MGDYYPRNRSSDGYRPYIHAHAPSRVHPRSHSRSRSRSPPRAFFQNVGTQWSVRVSKNAGGVVRSAELVNRGGGGNYNIKGTLPGGGLVVQTRSSAGTRAFAEEACRDMPKDGIVLIAIPVSTKSTKCSGDWDGSGLFSSPGPPTAPPPSAQPVATHLKPCHPGPVVNPFTSPAVEHVIPAQSTRPRMDLFQACRARTSFLKTEDLHMKIEQLRREAANRGHSDLPHEPPMQPTQADTQAKDGPDPGAETKQMKRESTAPGTGGFAVTTAPVICRENNRHKTCANCGRVGHAVIDCLKPGKSGFIEACAVCNEHHLLDICTRFHSYSVYRKLAICVLQRARRPPLATAFNWVAAYNQVADARTRSKAMPAPKSWVWPSDFPITAQEARSWLSRPAERQPWNYFNYSTNRTEDLSPGLSTWSPAVVLANCHRLMQTESYAGSFPDV
ncbi:hypothetical protein ACRALDRAFT_2051964 [Sodiomyces alcalophilus JCM 7366]|uniref:uncharacterized protein n=1 Tax=Sodiomyces alcalophilus JCM 7366 TaxID=591952 RepID=UPI0039B6E0C7